MEKLSKVAGVGGIVITFILVVPIFCNETDNGAVQLTEQNLNLTLESNEIVFIMFYTEWCRFSRDALPKFDDAANKIKKEYAETGKVVLAKLECDHEPSIAKRFRIERYPTFIVVINGQPVEQKYNGTRSTEAFISFVKEQLEVQQNREQRN